MKVGVFLNKELPEIGGGHTFISEIFHSILYLVVSAEAGIYA